MNKVDRIRIWELKVQWISNHPELWKEMDPNSPVLYREKHEQWLKISKGLKAAGLISSSTATIDVPIRKLITSVLVRRELEKTSGVEKFETWAKEKI